MRLDHLLSREQAKMETSELHTEVDEGKEIFRIQRKLQRSEKNVNERSGTAEKPQTRFDSVSFSRFAKSHLDNCTVKKDSEKTSLGK